MKEKIERLYVITLQLFQHKEIESVSKLIHAIDSPTLEALLAFAKPLIHQDVSHIENQFAHCDKHLPPHIAAGTRLQLYHIMQSSIKPPLTLANLHETNLTHEQQKALYLFLFEMRELFLTIGEALQALPDTRACIALNLIQEEVPLLEQCALIHATERLNALQKISHLLPHALAPRQDWCLSQSSFSQLLLLLSQQEQLSFIMELIETFGLQAFELYFGNFSDRLSCIDAGIQQALIDKKYKMNYQSNAYKNIVFTHPQGFLEIHEKLKQYRKELNTARSDSVDTENFFQKDAAIGYFLEILTGKPQYRNAWALDMLAGHKKQIENTPIASCLLQPPLLQLIAAFEAQCTYTTAGHWASHFSTSLSTSSSSSPIYQMIEGLAYTPIDGLIHVAGCSEDSDSLYHAYDLARQPKYAPMDIPTLRRITERHMEQNPTSYQSSSINTPALIPMSALSDVLRRTMVVLRVHQESKCLFITHIFNQERMYKSDPVFIYHAQDNHFEAFRVTGTHALDDILCELLSDEDKQPALSL